MFPACTVADWTAGFSRLAAEYGDGQPLRLARFPSLAQQPLLRALADTLWSGTAPPARSLELLLLFAQVEDEECACASELDITEQLRINHPKVAALEAFWCTWRWPR
jgi:hypothetical protein